MAFIWMCFLKLGAVLISHKIQMGYPLVLMSNAGVMINLVLMALNLIPIPPLDGSRVMSSFLPPRLDILYNKIAPFGFFIVLLLLISNVLQMMMMPIIGVFYQLLSSLFLS